MTTKKYLQQAFFLNQLIETKRNYKFWKCIDDDENVFSLTEHIRRQSKNDERAKSDLGLGNNGATIINENVLYSEKETVFELEKGLRLWKV